jgi:hypothetical protein
MNYFISYRPNGIFLSSKIDSDLFDDDDYDPPNLGGRRPNIYEWGDYILEEQVHYAYGISDGSISVNEEKPKRKHTPEEIVEILAQYQVLRNQGVDREPALFDLGISSSTLTNWRRNYKNLVFSSVKSGDVNAEQVA